MSQTQQSELAPPTDFGNLVEECARRGIRRNVAFRLAREKLLDTFLIGGKRYVYIESLQTLPKRLEASRV